MKSMGISSGCGENVTPGWILRKRILRPRGNPTVSSVSVHKPWSKNTCLNQFLCIQRYISIYIYKMCYFWGGEMIRSATRPCHGNLMAVYITWNRPCPAPANQQAQKTQRTLWVKYSLPFWRSNFWMTQSVNTLPWKKSHASDKYPAKTLFGC